MARKAKKLTKKAMAEKREKNRLRKAKWVAENRDHWNEYMRNLRRKKSK